MGFIGGKSENTRRPRPPSFLRPSFGAGYAVAFSWGLPRRDHKHVYMDPRLYYIC